MLQCCSINRRVQRTFHPELIWQSYPWVRYIYYHLIASAESLVKLCYRCHILRSIISVKTEERQWSWILTWCVWIDVVCFMALACYWFKHVAPTLRKPNQSEFLITMFVLAFLRDIFEYTSKDTKYERYRRSQISPTSRVTFPVVSHVIWW